MNKSVCKCGHFESDHANHYEYHQCYILGCVCVKFEAVQQGVQRTCAQCGADDWRDAIIPDSVEICNRCGASR